MNVGRNIEIFTDGGCSLRKKAAIAFVILDGNKELKRYSRRLKEDNPEKLTNNVAELMAAISALKWVVENIDYTVTIYLNSDSDYLVMGMSQWIDGWIEKGWKNANRKPIANKELWLMLLSYEAKLKNNNSSIFYQWVRGHKNNINYNVVVDELCTEELNKEL